jgi:hypothetical protein
VAGASEYSSFFDSLKLPSLISPAKSAKADGEDSRPEIFFRKKPARRPAWAANHNGQIGMAADFCLIGRVEAMDV